MIFNYPRAVQCNNGFVYSINVGKTAEHFTVLHCNVTN
jgi:hypothetical protein